MSDSIKKELKEVVIGVILDSVKNLFILLMNVRNGTVDPATVNLDAIKIRQKAIIRPPIRRG